MLWTVFIALLVLWLMGLSIHVGGVLIHFLLGIGFGGRHAAPPIDIHPRVLIRAPAAVHL